MTGVGTRPAPAPQQPDWPDPQALSRTLGRLRERPGLVTPAECDRLRDRLAEVAAGRAFLVQGGDCAERLDRPAPGDLERKLETLLQLGAVLGHATSTPVVTVGRMAGQYAKPRSRPTETRDGVTLPAYRGDSVNGPEFTAAARRPDPARLERAYEASARTLAVLRATTGPYGDPGGTGPGGTGAGWADPGRVRDRLREFVRSSPASDRYAPLAGELDRVPPGGDRPEVFASHEALLLDYEDALTRTDPVTGARYGLSGHLLWLGERTRRPDGRHVGFAAAISNPVAVKIGPSARPEEVLELIDRLDPDRRPGRLTLITRMGAGLVQRRLPELVERVTAAGAVVAWVCDPMHGNTFEAANGRKTRRFDDVLDELRGFFAVHRRLGTHPGGVHLELTGDEVTECLGGGNEVFTADLHRRYETACDPRLSRGQALDLAFGIAEMCRSVPALAR